MKIQILTLFPFLSLTTGTPLSIPSAPLKRNPTPSCPTGYTLPPTYLTPSLLLPVSKSHPNAAYPSTKFPQVTPNNTCFITNFIIPPSASGKTCTLTFLFPSHLQTTLPYLYYSTNTIGQKSLGQKGGKFSFTGYAFGSGGVEGITTYNNQPPPGPSPPFPPSVLEPGNNYVVNVGDCGVQPEMAEGLEVSGLLCSEDSYLEFLQGSGLEGCPLGFFVGIA